MGILLAGCQTTSAPPGSDSGSKPVISSFTATPPSIAAGAQSTLSWSVSGATSLSITGLGTVSGESIVVQPETTTTYTLTASNSAGSATMDATVIVGDSGGGGGGGGDTAAAYFLPFDVDGGVTNTIYTAMAVGGDGVVHVVYAENGTADNTPLYYGECAGPCTGPDNFTMVSLPSGWSSPSMLNLAVDASGHPRLLWEVYRGFGYAECEGGCTNAANWTVTTIDVGTSVLDGSNRMLALDASGRPRVLYNDDTSSHYGTFLLSCDSACATTGTWSESLAFGDPLTRPSLVITASGVPVFAAIQEGNPEAHLLYLECPDATCSSPAAGVQLPDASYFYSDYALRLTDDGRPRIVLSTGGGADGLNSNEPNPVLY
ncbi:MAG TPA: hypothetical protein VF171_03425, partial [Trueperaceae bacterium]